MGSDITKGYCFLHDQEYKIKSPDDVCPRCLKAKRNDLTWRDEESTNE
jgi:hypothetical protein